MRALGVEVEENKAARLIVHGRGLHGLQEPDGVLDCARSGTTLRLLAGLQAGQPFLSVLTGEESTDFNILMAASAIVIFPVVVLYFALQRRFIEGVAGTGLKG